MGRLKMSDLGLKGQSAVDKKEATYQKLTVFKEFEDNAATNITLNEEEALLQAFQLCTDRNPNIKDLLSQKTMDKLQKIYDRRQNQ